ncbi:MAG: AzlC family ABC transporter permease [Clostridia bacterium]|nr:AzlC family ABC transporter permease [Clostridia bacterium]
MEPSQNSFRKGVRDGIPICIGYLSVSFAFGVFAVGWGFNIWEAVLMSFTNVTSAGQLAAVPIMATGGSILELAATQLTINIRYALMSVSVSQKLDEKVSVWHRLLIGFAVTDEIFGVSSSQSGRLGTRYMLGLESTPILGWTVGTLLGAVAGNLLPHFIISALGIAIYGMFIAIVVPPAKKSLPVLGCVLTAAALGCLFRYVPGLNQVPSGYVIIIVGILSATLFAILCPRNDSDESAPSDGKEDLS